MSSVLKNVQINRVVQNNINTCSFPKSQEVPMDTEKPLKSTANPNSSYEKSILTTMSSEDDINQKALLDISSKSKNENLMLYPIRTRNISMKFMKICFWMRIHFLKK